jgi:tRNA(fMet)-specific endonuclease VapC
MYILDTNTLVYFFKGVGNVAQNLFAVSPPGCWRAGNCDL